MIEPPKEDDVPALVGLMEDMMRHYGRTEFEPAAVRAQQIRAALFGTPPTAHALVARDGAELVGIATYSFQWPSDDLRPAVSMKDLYVAGPHRGRGVGEKLVRALRAIAAERGSGRLEWMVNTWNDGARRFYDRLGARPHDSVVYRMY
ncbi:MAG: GNAT family N-acetyltransferase [Actinophytocola sp.]|uniref:GNAT family N-acetyltransferase n=1 Tax=Actinophytocola sp. TaxID=1872138 RepID=UPI003D6BE6A5